jgi:hypothetical protein
MVTAGSLNEKLLLAMGRAKKPALLLFSDYQGINQRFGNSVNIKEFFQIIGRI